MVNALCADGESVSSGVVLVVVECTNVDGLVQTPLDAKVNWSKESVVGCGWCDNAQHVLDKNGIIPINRRIEKDDATRFATVGDCCDFLSARRVRFLSVLVVFSRQEVWYWDDEGVFKGIPRNICRKVGLSKESCQRVVMLYTLHSSLACHHEALPSF